MTTLKLSHPVDLEALNAVCEGVTAPVRIGVDDGELTLLLAGPDAADCAELLADWLRLAGVEVL